MENQEQLKQLILNCISEQRSSEINRGSYDVKSSLYALSSVYALVETHKISSELSPENSLEDTLKEYIQLMYDFQRRYRANPLDCDEYGGGGAVIGSVISDVVCSARKSGIAL